MSEGSAAAAIEAAVDRRRRALVADGKIDNLDQRMAEVTVEETNKFRLATLLQRKWTGLAVAARDRTEAYVETLRRDGLSPKEAELAVFEGTARGPEGWHSVYATRLAFEARYVGDMAAEVLRAVPEAVKLTRDPVFAEDIVREMFEIREGGKPGHSGNPDAQTIAHIFALYAEVSRIEINRLGANIEKLDAWGGPHVHDAAKMLRISADAWVRRIIPRLDLPRTFPDATPGEAMDLLDAIYGTITTGTRFRPAEQIGIYHGPRDLVRMLFADPVLRFRTADDWLAHQAEFGHGNIWTGMLAHQRKMAAIAAEIQILGPSPQATIDSLAPVVSPDGAACEALPVLQRTTGVALGVNPAGMTEGLLLLGQRASRSMARFGDGIGESVANLVTQAAKLRYRGRFFFATCHDEIIEMIATMARSADVEPKEIAMLVAEGMEGLLDSLHSSAFAEDGRPGAMSSAMTNFLRWSGPTNWTDNVRVAGARMLCAHMGRMSRQAWETLPQRLRAALDRHGLSERCWRLIQQAAFEGPTDNSYVTPDRIGRLPQAAFDRAPAASEIRDSRDLALALQRFYAEEISFASARRPGTFIRDLLRAVIRLRGAPIARPRGSDTVTTPHIGSLLACTMMASYIAMTAKALAGDYDRSKFVNPDGSANRRALLTAFARGGAGIYGDYLFSQVDRFRMEPRADAAGDDIATPSRLVENFNMARGGDGEGGRWLNAVLMNTPFVNLSCVRPAVDFLVLDALRESLSPGFLERQRQESLSDRTQSILFPRLIGSSPPVRF
jgi:hypothetical protein